MAEKVYNSGKQMKFSRYLQEGVDTEKVAANIIKTLKDRCSEFLKDSRRKLYYRGGKLDAIGITGMTEVVPRTDRLPKDTPLWLHKTLDKMFQEKFGWKVRSEGVFVNQDKLRAAVYGQTHLFFPVDGFKFVWAPYIDDLYDNLHVHMYLEKKNSLNLDTIKSWIHYLSQDIIEVKVALINSEPDAKKLLMKTLKMIVDGYRDDGLYVAHDKEVAFKCSSYYLVDNDYKNFILDALK